MTLFRHRDAAERGNESSKKYNYFAVPIDEGGSTTVEWSLDIQSDKLKLKFDLHDGELNSFLDFIDNSNAAEARLISRNASTLPPGSNLRFARCSAPMC